MKIPNQTMLLETDRLVMRCITRDDAPFIYRLLKEPSWLEFIGDKNINNENDAKKYIEMEYISMYQKYGFGLFIVETKDTNNPIGICGLMKRENLDDADLGYALLPEFWGKGFAFEAVMSVLKSAKDTHKLSRILALSKSSNRPSINLLNKAGFVFDRDLKLLEDEEKLHIYKLRL